ncbi:MAG: hypothetical protein WB706_10090, partial [Nitrososphaeraceae archaeon]
DILVTEKNTGNVMRIVNGVASQQPLLHVEVAKKDERGLLGVAISKICDSCIIPYYIDSIILVFLALCHSTIR